MRIAVAFVALALAVAALPQASRSLQDSGIAATLQKNFSQKPAYAQVKVQVEDRIVTLSGTVPSMRDKVNAVHQARQVDGVHGYIDDLAVAGPTVPDDQLKRQLSDRLTYDRMFEGQTFNALTLGVQHGVVTVGGQVRDYPDRDSALDIIADTQGVKGMVDKIQVAPLNPMDDQIRLEAARRIYGNPVFLRYANDPAHPIRIVVRNGHVTLVGVVDSQVDKALAGNQVRSIPGVFSLKNDLVVAR
ncbi:MAG TPA: BON domain-containing protein [Terriglobales bacterium]|nr:BON domain-containing protein [Terriglobales bacterium]